MGEVLGVGVDIEAVGRFEHFNQQSDQPFLQRVFTANELRYCFAQARPAQHLAARYAAKEAVVKALAAVFPDALSYDQIEIVHTASQAPVVRLRHAVAEAFSILISLAHAGDRAIAFALLQKK